uniref:Kelch-like protein 13 isoform X2 n=1 Tax=Geotrypetes seraphini TaxID=260995 RepID=A0A6P8R2B4_GEOSA|nr:kelch-like protein 13 isoform X2 [Geotrypetes seraphini]XP_033802184.1 kelch-like protein 13 isoform X2 [Geotrypetes seraphini]XP_033802185.1 kelch-like protein 13 isoform X2 [Geotrypetes seraphini]
MDHPVHRGEMMSAVLHDRSLVEEEDPHMKVSLGSNDMGVSAHLQTSKTGGTTRFFTSNTHSSVVLQGFDQLRIEGLLSDVTLVPGDGEEVFPVHRAMMASASDYFKAMFTGGMKEQDLMCIKLHGVNKIGLKKIIDFIYTAKLSLNMDNLQDTLEAASFLQILPVLDFCKVFLISGMSEDLSILLEVDSKHIKEFLEALYYDQPPKDLMKFHDILRDLYKQNNNCMFVSLENCVEIGRIANTFNLTEVDKYVNNFILKNFLPLLSTGEFVKLPFDRLAFVLSSNSLKLCTELELFKAACRWLRYEEPRMEYAAKLMKNIRFPLMTPQDLINHVQTVDFMRTDNTCVNLLLEASNYQMMPFMQPVMQSERTAIRSDSSHLVTLGGVLRQQLVVSKELRMYDEKAHEWKSLAPMDAPRYQHGIAVIGNFLYVVGGQSNYDTKGKTAVDTVFRFDPRYNKWMQVASLNEKRTFFHLSALKGHLYAVGGRNAAGELATVECYNPRMNEWSYVAKMNEPHYGHAGTVFGGLMYISGGITHDTFQKELMCFDPDTDKWTQKAPMTTVRGLHCMCTVGDKLYVIGGNHFRGTSDYDDVLSCEYYSPSLDQWTPIAAMLRGQSDVGVAVFENKIYVVGGYSWNNRCMVEIVQKYDPEKDEWHKVFDLPESLGGIRACTLTVFPPEDNTGSPCRESPLSAP